RRRRRGPALPEPGRLAAGVPLPLPDAAGDAREREWPAAAAASARPQRPPLRNARRRLLAAAPGAAALGELPAAPQRLPSRRGAARRAVSDLLQRRRAGTLARR